MGDDVEGRVCVCQSRFWQVRSSIVGGAWVGAPVGTWTCWLGSAGGSSAERGWPEDLDPPVLLGGGPDPIHVHWPGADVPVVVVADGFTGVAIERFTTSRRVQAQHSRPSAPETKNVCGTPRRALAMPPAPTVCSAPSRCIRISPSSTTIVSSESGWMCSGVTLPWSMRSSNRRNAPSVSAAVAFQMCRPPPKNQRRSPSSLARTKGCLVGIALIAFPHPFTGHSSHDDTRIP